MPSAPITLSAFTFDALVVALLWGVWVVLNLWLWQKTKAIGNLLMLVGAGLEAFYWLMLAFGEFMTYWVSILALGALTAGFYLSVKPMVEAHLAKLREKIHKATGGGTSGEVP